MGVVDPSLQKKPMRLSDGRYLAALHRLLKLPERLLADQLPATAFFHPAYQHFLKAPFLVGGEPSLALVPTVAQGFGCFS